MKILITGGFGYVGGRLAQRFAEQGHEIYLGTRQHVTEPIKWLPGAKVRHMSWESQNELNHTCKGMELIIHAAGMNAKDCMNHPVEALAFNGLATAQLLQAAKTQGVRRFIFISTAHVYSSPLVGVIHEETQPKNLHPYATSCRAGEDVVLHASDRGDLEGIVIRLSNAFGAPAHPFCDCWSLLVNDLCKQAVTTKNMILHSSREQRRDFIPLTEVCRALEHISSLPIDQFCSRLFNLGSGWTPTFREMAEFVQKQCELILNFRPQISYHNTPDSLQSYEIKYQFDLIKQTGFHQTISAPHLEIQHLLEFCRTTMA